ncbi:MAG: glutathione S-transferase N-terminal domain-containing protein [Proteobacteria bacterium]|nr:glutathione S-transferase N-terminal domain-containing protein [Pseudomonadota bacterium]MDA1332077.1 glutathione S-transferase N-terminal domain-containing protein [Pseudomonadota bacterium]
MKLLGYTGSPYVRKACIVAEEKRSHYEIVAASPSDPASGVQAANPLGKIPVLICDDGSAIYDSVVIVEYLDGLGAGTKLIPETFADRIQVKRWEALGDGIAEATISIVVDQRLPAAEQRGETLYTKQKKKIDAGLATMEKDLGSRQFCHGTRFTLADIACGVALGYLDQAMPKFDWRKTHPGLGQLAERLAAREAFIKTKYVPA